MAKWNIADHDLIVPARPLTDAEAKPAEHTWRECSFMADYPSEAQHGQMCEFLPANA